MLSIILSLFAGTCIITDNVRCDDEQYNITIVNNISMHLEFLFPIAVFITLTPGGPSSPFSPLSPSKPGAPRSP